MPKRWYDTDPTLSLAISMLKNADDEKQNSVCEVTQNKIKELGINSDEKFVIFKIFDKRWYDEKENLYNLLETIRCCSEEDKRTIAIFIIDYLCNLVRA